MGCNRQIIFFLTGHPTCYSAPVARMGYSVQRAVRGIAAGMEESMRDHFLRGDSYQISRMYPVVHRFRLSYSEAHCIRNWEFWRAKGMIAFGEFQATHTYPR
jgi:hypothetical protein